MTPSQGERPVVVEPLDTARHDRSAFRCGIAQVDNYFQKTANKLSKADNVRVFVMLSPERALIGFYALNAHAVDYAHLPAAFARNRPRHGSIPAAYLSMMGVDARFAGQGYGTSLLIDALLRIHRLSREIGTSVVMLDVLDCGDPARVARRRAFYTRFGFTPLLAAPQRLFLPIATIGKLPAL